MMVGAELFRQGPRPFAMSIVGLTNWVFTAIVAISFEMIQVMFIKTDNEIRTKHFIMQKVLCA